MVLKENKEQMTVRLAEDGNPILDQFSAEGFVDCTFRIVRQLSSESAYRLHLSASHQGETVGFDVVVVKGIRGGFDDRLDLISDHVYHDGVWFFRSGPESDSLMTILTKLYKLEGEARRMIESFAFTVIALHQDDVNMECHTINLKLFGNDSETFSEEDYFESFFNLSLSDGFAFWNEKDPDYRVPLIKSLSSGPAI